MRELFRAMRMDTQGRPERGPGFGTLQVRIPRDIAPDDAGLVHPAAGGLSVNPDRAENVPLNLRHKPGFRVYVIGENALGSRLTFRLDPVNPIHGFVEPSAAMALADYQGALQNTRDDWKIAP